MSVPNWPGALGADVAGAEVVIGRLDALAALPPPSPGDLVDAGRRSGERLRLFLRRRAALRLLAGRRLAIDPEAVAIGYDKRGAPVLRTRAGRLRVSVSARGEIAGFAMAMGPVGIDLEPVADPVAIDAVLGPDERAALAAAIDPAVMALQYWTAKEAYLKALGTGLMRDPAAIAVIPGGAGAFGMRDATWDAPGRGAWLTVAPGGARTIVAVWCFGAMGPAGCP